MNGQDVAPPPIKKKQLFRAYIVAGFNATQVDGDRMGGYNKFGGIGGVGVLIKVVDDVTAGVEINYSMKGSKSSIEDSRQYQGLFFQRKISLDYIDVPLTMNYTIRKQLMFTAGLVFNTLVRSKDVQNGYEVDNEFRRFGLEGLLGASYIFANRLGLGMRFSYSATRINVQQYATTFGNDGNQRNNVLSVRAFYLF